MNHKIHFYEKKHTHIRKATLLTIIIAVPNKLKTSNISSIYLNIKKTKKQNETYQFSKTF